MSSNLAASSIILGLLLGTTACKKSRHKEDKEKIEKVAISLDPQVPSVEVSPNEVSSNGVELTESSSFSEVIQQFFKVDISTAKDCKKECELIRKKLEDEPELVSKFAVLLEEYQPEDAHFDAIVVILSEVKSGAGQLELMNFINDNFGHPRWTKEPLARLSMLERPTPKMVESALAWLKDQSPNSAGYTQAMMAAAAIGSHSDKQMRKDMANAIADNAYKYMSDDLTNDSLKALAVLKYENTFTLVREYFYSSDQVKRINALNAIQHQKNEPLTMSLLMNLVRDDSDYTVRERAKAILESKN